MRDHGGNLDEAIARFGGSREEWVDLSTGINRVPYPVPPISAHAWRDLPTRSDLRRLADAARTAYGANCCVLPVAGAQAAIQMVPRLRPPGFARIVSPTYNEHAAALVSAGWRVEPVRELADLAGADLAVVVNPNNPDGRSWTPLEVLAVADRIGLMVVDESFCDATEELSLCPQAGRDGLVVLRSFGKFYGLAGLRLGFTLVAESELESMRATAGPWPVTGAAVETGCTALIDAAWKRSAIVRLQADAARLDALAAQAGWKLAGGTALFRTYETPDAISAQERLAASRVWSRVFPYSRNWLRLGLPGEGEWERVMVAIGAA